VDEALENEGKPVNIKYQEDGFIMVNDDISGVVMNIQDYLLRKP